MITSLSDFLASDYYEMLQADYYTNIQHQLLNGNEERAERMYIASSNGYFGITIAESIEDIVDAVDLAFQDNFIDEETDELLQKEIKELYQWHENNNSLDTEI